MCLGIVLGKYKRVERGGSASLKLGCDRGPYMLIGSAEKLQIYFGRMNHKFVGLQHGKASLYSVGLAVSGLDFSMRDMRSLV